jgi:Ca2+/Na+ antiporter
MDRMLTLFDWLQGNTGLWAWGVLLGMILLWGLCLQGVANVMSRNRIRPMRVIVQTRSILFMIGVIFLFDLAVVPVVLVYLNWAVPLCLGICIGIALLYFVCVNDQDQDREHDLFP